jgi:hypothetical protein
MALPSKNSFWKVNALPRLRQRDARDAVRWFKSKADAEMSDVAKASKQFGANRKKLQKPQIGEMYLYKYWAKWDKTLPTWDQHPLCIPFEYTKNGFMGMNMHYLPVPQRYALMATLMQVATKAKGRQDERLIISHKIIKGLAKVSLYEPTVHRYLWSQLRSPFLYITPDEWRIALAMPVQKWKRGRPY